VTEVKVGVCPVSELLKLQQTGQFPYMSVLLYHESIKRDLKTNEVDENIDDLKKDDLYLLYVWCVFVVCVWVSSVSHLRWVSV
jgi:hypothetical protein